MDEGRTSANGPQDKKIITMYKAFHLRDDIDRLHVLRKLGGRSLVRMEEKMDASIWRREDYIKKSRKRLICYGNLPTTAWTLPAITSSRYCSKAKGNIPADNPGSLTETVSLVTLSFVYAVLLFFVNIFLIQFLSCVIISGP